MHVVMLLYPGMTQLDLTGPFEVLVQFKDSLCISSQKTAIRSSIRAACG